MRTEWRSIRWEHPQPRSSLPELSQPSGNTTESTWSSLLEGRSGIGPITHFDTEGHPVRIAGEVNILIHRPDQSQRCQEDGPLHTVCGERSAHGFEDAGLEVKVPEPDRTGVS